MRIYTLALICVVFGGSCQISQQAESSDAPVNANESEPSAESPSPSAEVKEQAEVDTSRFIPIEIKRIDHQKKYELNVNVRYPQLSNANTAGERSFNQFVKDHVDVQMNDITKFLTRRGNEIKSEVKDEYEVNLDYKVDYFSENLASIVMNWNGFFGYLNYDYFPSTINYDLKRGKVIELKDIFEPNAQYLDKLSELALAKLRRTCLGCPCEGSIHAGDPLPDGKTNEIGHGRMFDLSESVSAKEENFEGWSLTPNGLKITFDEYQVGPGCIGIIHIIIPYSDLQPILKNDLGFV